ncbi:MAG: tRNA (adenosine(37)-N6)-dimethylallyltransferase MiaA [Clostridia bacterium]
MNKILCIVGPTASGKSAFAIEVAKQLNSEIISADSMQIYKHMNIGTAKICQADTHIKHHLLDIVEPFAEFSVANYQTLALPIIEQLIKDNKTPIVCGGTGLYINSILYPLNFSETSKNNDLRDSLKAKLNEFGAEYMHDWLCRLDTVSAEKIHTNDTKRVLRALEINLNFGLKVNTEIKQPQYEYLMIGFNPNDRKTLYDRIDNRVDTMFLNGLTTEVENLIKNGVTFDCQSMQAIGYKEFKQYFSGDINITELKELIKQHSRNYAKRQLTWFKKYNDIVWFDKPCDEAITLVNNTFLRK